MDSCGAPGQPQLGADLRLVQDMAHRQAQLGGAHGRKSQDMDGLWGAEDQPWPCLGISDGVLGRVGGAPGWAGLGLPLGP